MLYVLIALFVIAEIFSLRAILFLTNDLSLPWRMTLISLYSLWTIGIIIMLVYGFIHREKLNDSVFMNGKYLLMSFFVVNFFFKMLLGGFHGLNEGISVIANQVSDGSMTRSKFLTLSGLALASIPFSTMLYGMAKGRFNYRVIKQKVRIPNLPEAFKGVKFVHISDLHLGSIPKGSKELMKAVEKINALQPDYILFTGDMINERAEEVERHIETLQQLASKRGTFSVLGNHDYGNYYGPWANDLEKQNQNVRRLASYQKQIGFDLLLNENRVLEIEGESIRLIGLENWGTGHFSKHGDLKKALAGVSDDEVQILMSHDPSHWDEEVLGKTSIDLALAGHTHGCQYGVEVPGFKWSPVQYRYPRWAGLYKEQEQQLYVNRGLGCIGYAGRFGMPPEITLIELV